MKKLLSILLSVFMIAALAATASAVVLTWDEGDQTWWSPEFDYNIDPGTTDEYIVVLEDGTVSGNQGNPSWNPDSASTPTGLAEQPIESSLITNLNPGWYEAAFFDIGEDCTGAEGKIALISRGSTTFTVKNENAKAAGAFATIIMNNGNGETIDDTTYFMEGNNGAIGMYEDYEIMPNCSVSTDVSIRILAQMYGISLADAYDAVLNLQIEGVSGLDIGKTTHVFLGTMADYEKIGAYDASKLITAENALKADAVKPGSTEAPPPPEAAAEEREIPEGTALKNDGKSYDDAESAAKALGTQPIMSYTYVSGTSGNGGEGAMNLWDNDTATKFCTSNFPAISIAKTDAPVSVNGIIMATANDNSSYNGRSPNEWAIFGSADGENWTAIAQGDDAFFEETDFTYYAASINPTEAYQYFQFQAMGTDSGTFQVSELVLCSADIPAAPVEINDGAVEVRGEYRFYTEQPEIKGECLVDVNSDMDEISGYRGEIGTDLFNLASGGSGYCVKRDTCVWYDFEAPADGTYLFMIEYVARQGAERGVDWALDDAEGTNRHFIDLMESDDHTFVVSTFETTKGKHSFYVYAPTDMDDSTLKSCDTYWVYVYAIPDGLAAALPTVEATSAAAVPAGYPASGESGNAMIGTIIGNETGWDGTAASGAASAFDGNPATFFDPLGVGDGYCGMQFDEPYILEKVAILSRSGWLDRFAGACIEGSNNGEDWETIWESDEAAASETEYTVVTEGDFENNYGYTMFRYFNYLNHGDVAEVEFYGKPGKVDPPAKEEEPAAEEPKEETPTTVEEVVENAAENVTEAAENVAEAAGDAVENAAEAVTGAVDNAAKKSGCGSFIGGSMIVLVTVLGSAWIAKRK